ncbi:helix-turn-helix transcriptional regulator [Fangia hongkongensis]|uniref:helix-turn-helix transcriptional regulator n=1 Tax=Fangia hongkongensis TaxID=270495 RepID=UPI000368960F|nr:hypothetical protein [Fangia hongkongensis]MBK2123933.1 hypothetical protein [Fangia hongkongensis]
MDNTTQDHDKINQAFTNYTHRHNFSSLQIVRELRQYLDLKGLILAWLWPNGRIIDIPIIPHEISEAWNSFDEKIFEPTYNYQNILYLASNQFSYQCILDSMDKDCAFPMKDQLNDIPDKASFYIRPMLDGSLIRLEMNASRVIPITYFIQQKLNCFIDTFLQYINDKNLLEYYDFTGIVRPYSIAKVCQSYTPPSISLALKQFSRIKHQLILLIYHDIRCIKDIAKRLSRSPRTIEKHLDEMREVFACRTRYELYILISQSPEIPLSIMKGNCPSY